MASRGSEAKNGHYSNDEYETVEVLAHGKKS